MLNVKSALLGGARFDENEEYLQFKFRFLFALMIFGASSSTLFVASHYSGINRLDSPHVTTMAIHVAISLFMAAILYNRKHLFRIMAWIYGIICFFVLVSALVLVPTDEARVLWFLVNIPAYYLLLGSAAGFAVTVISIICIVVLNPHIPAGYSPNAMATIIISLCYISLFFYVYSSRAVSFFNRMLDSNEKLRFMASHDALTGVLNARTYYEVSDQLIKLALRDNKPFSVLFIDLDHFKRINDQYGHDAGDTVLKAVSACLARESRESDLLGRIGGEEFSMFLPETDLDGAAVLAEKLRVSIESIMPEIDSRQIKVTASIGVARNRPEHINIATIQSHADQAMYHAKKSGRNRVSCIDAAMNDFSLEMAGETA